MQVKTQGLQNLNFTRRTILKAGAVLASCIALPSVASASVNPAFRTPARSVFLLNPRTGEKINTVYWEKGTYHAEPLNEIAWIMRDQHDGEMSPIDPKLMDILHVMQTTLRTKHPFEVVCGYRTPKSNAFIYKHERGVGRNSYHMYGRAIDIRLADRTPSQIQRVAWNLQQGGVGYYPAAGFVHVDTGSVRRW